MAAENEPAKLLLPYLQRADELQKHEHLVAYYCRLYAMERGLRIPQSDRTKMTNSLLVSLMNQLEKDRKSLKLGPDDYLHVEGFASNVFSKADKQDRAGRADLNTAKTFYAASIFFEILNQFGELQPDLEQKQKYAAWKAADIRKALKEGRKPIPGPPGGDTDLSVPSSTYNGANDLEPSRSDVADLGTRSDLARVDSAARTAPAPDSFPQAYDHDNLQHSTDFSQPPSNVMGSPASGIPPQSHHPTDNYSGVDPASRMAPDSDSFPQAYNRDNFQHPTSFSRLPSNVAAPPPSTMAPPSHFPSENIHQPPNGSEHSVYHHQSHPHPPYQPEPHQSIPQNYPSHDIPSFASYPNFQSYPSFSESSLPAAPSHYPSYYQGSDVATYTSSPPSNAAAYYQGSDVATYTSSPPSNAAAPYASTPQYSSSGKNGSLSEVSPPTSERYEYDSSYQPPPEKIAEAHKAARFAVGALAFDEVSVAVDHLKKALDLLTNQSSAH
ncbi:protein HOMOLOG OF MAMMALIAN LYST-INTERACTING PROTEIN 5 [Salvia miltiorrhiza]|uniref:protein HOMOLOG OF MAMMALIAN LYST-INTERACTING PROTEIN 5 n=1 Tax=Salvia miltiorrhiza TaxID=226208 RepID=UPI0025ACA761|nr:protein HOMOLOG OF MAMMALIAN LYST-INTERACTING PROTEIN 5 [Salvia miltiorrhiza]